MITYRQFQEDLEQRQMQSTMSQQARVQAEKDRVKTYTNNLQAKKEKEEEHEEIIQKVMKRLGYK